MSKCKVCCKYSKNNPDIKFFRFPKDSYRCAIWANRCNIFNEFSKSDSKYFYKTYRICSDHFSNNHIKWDGHRAKLMPDAVPEVINRPFQANIIEHKHLLAGLSQPNEQVEPCLDFDKAEFHLQTLNHVCRFCAVERTNLTMLFGAYGRSLDLPTKIKYIPIKLSENDVMPTKICKECIKKVEEGYLFVQSCVEADEKLRIYLDMSDKDTSYEKIPCNVTAKNSANEEIDYEKNNTKPCSSTIINQIVTEVHSTQCSISNLREIDLSASLALQNDYAGMFIRECGVNVKTSNNKKSRNFIKNNKAIKFSCDHCHRNFHNLDILNAHVKAHFLVKDNNENFTCDECDISFRNRFHLSSHRRRHFNEKPYECLKCNARFYNSSLLRQHALTHSPKQFSCEICKKDFLRKSKLLIHIQDSNHFYNQVSEEEEVQNVKRDNYKCVTCTKSFSKLSSLQRHWKTHWPVNKFLCAFCGKLFTRMDSLTKHYRIHTGERPYSCYVCAFSFKQRGDCKKHEENH